LTNCDVAAEAISGRVFLDANNNGQMDAGESGIPKVAVTDGVQIVQSGADGAYRFELADDPVLPLRAARTVAVSWPSNTWPSSPWWRRLDQVQPGQAINFGLVRDQQKIPFAIVHATDPHDAFRREFNFLWRQDVGRMGDLVRFAVVTGDLGYMSADNADKDFTDIRQFTRDFPVPMFHTPGNHDIVGIHSTDWKQPTDIHGNGAFTKYLGPVRWSFTYAGVHIFGLDWARVEPNGTLQTGHPTTATDWLEADLSRLPEGTRTIGFAHCFGGPDPRFWQIARKHRVELLMAGHNHRNRDLTEGDLEYHLTMSLSKIVHVKAKGHQLVDYCQGYNLSQPGTHVGHCRLFVLEQFQPRRGEHEGVIDKRLEGKFEIKPMQTRACELELTIEPEAARRFGVRLTTGANATDRCEVAIEGNQITAGDLSTAAGRRPDDKNVHLHLLWDNGLLEIRCNKRSFFTQTLPGQGPLGVELFAEGGPAVFRQMDLWELTPGTNEQLMDIAGHYARSYQTERAAPYYRAVLSANPDHVEANSALAGWLTGRGRGKEALPLLERVLQVQPDHLGALRQLAEAFGAAGDREKSISRWRQLFAIQPGNAEAGNQLAWLLATAPGKELRGGPEAVTVAETVCKATNRDNPAYLDTLAVAYAEVGRFADAVRTAEAALALAEKKNDSEVAAEARKHLELFKQGQAFHEAE